MISRHHILHGRAEWMATPESKALRSTVNLIPKMDRELHDELHRECPPVPLLGRLTLQNALRVFQPEISAVQSTERLMEALDSQHRAQRHPIEKELLELSVWALELQLPFLKENESTQRVL